jgi:hypothetical protein
MPGPQASGCLPTSYGHGTLFNALPQCPQGNGTPPLTAHSAQGHTCWEVGLSFSSVRRGSLCFWPALQSCGEQELSLLFSRFPPVPAPVLHKEQYRPLFPVPLRIHGHSHAGDSCPSSESYQ